MTGTSSGSFAEPLDDPTHPELSLAPAYALGALDEDERATFAAHLAGCDACAAEVRAHGDVAALLPLALSTARPSAALRARVLAAAASAPRTRGAARGRDADVVPDVVPIGRAPSRGRPARAWPGWLAAAAALLLAAGLGARLRDERQARTLAESGLARARAEVAERETLLASVLAPEVRTARLTSTGQGPDVRVIWNRRDGVVIVTAQALSPAPAGRTYQLWGIQTGGAPQSLGTFDADPTGAARIVLRVPAGAAMDVAAITVEPAGGSPGPTSAPVLAGPIRAD